VTKLLWHSNAPWTPTGYGQQTAEFAPLLAEKYDLTISSFYGLDGSPIVWNDIPVLPGSGHDYGNYSLPRHAKHMFDDPRGGIVVTLMDVFVLDATMAADLNMACWCPVDHEPAPPGVTEFLMRSGAVPIAMSKFGQQMLGRLDPLYVPHGINTNIYKPGNRREVRRRYGVPEDAFLVGMVAANKGRPSRKGFSQAFQAFAKFAQEHDNAYLYLHTMLDHNLAQGENIVGLLESLGVPDDRIRACDQYRATSLPYTHPMMADIYTSMDVLLNPAMGEGFGITVLEAQACGTPAIVTDFTAMREVCAAGWHVDHTPYWTGLNSWQAVAKPDDILSALEECYALPKRKREQLAAAARKHALKYDTDRVFQQHLLPALKIVEQRFTDRHPVSIAPRLKAAA
jgi:glycosyltransferase involved in cell wall biosynthesis